jgi:hypothetical protein
MKAAERGRTMSLHAVEETTFSLSRRAPSPPERRQQPRHITILRVGAVIIGGRRELCLIRNISAGGLMAHVYSRIAVGQKLEVDFKTNQPLSGRVSWVDGSNVGIAFDTIVDVEELLAAQAADENGWRPRLPRVEVDRLGTLRAGAHVYPFSTRDISQGGLKIEIDQPLEEGTEIVVTLDKFRPLPGVVRWTGDGLCGIAFNQVIPFHELMKWLRS